MTRDEFLQAIRTTPDDVTLRLVFADWLEEQNDPLAEFIRVQCELEPLRQDYDSTQVKESKRREEEMLATHRAEWLGPLLDLEGPSSYNMFEPIFRNGLVDEVRSPLDMYVLNSKAINQWCPVFQHLTLFGVRDRAAELVEVSELQSCRKLELADWLTAKDAQDIANCPHLHSMERLKVWLGGEDEEDRCRIFGAATALKNLREIELVQLLGGRNAGSDPAVLNRNADHLAEIVDQQRGEKIATITRPFARRFPLLGDSGRDFYTGTLPKDRQALVILDSPYDGSSTYALILVIFDQSGNILDVKRNEPMHYPTMMEHEMYLYLEKRYGFRPGCIHVNEFELPEVFDVAVIYWPDHYMEHIQSPDNPPAHIPPEEVLGYTNWIYRWMEDRSHVFLWGNDYWVGPDGRIHSS